MVIKHFERKKTSFHNSQVKVSVKSTLTAVPPFACLLLLDDSASPSAPLPLLPPLLLLDFPFGGI